jgi:hypothetical protein
VKIGLFTIFCQSSIFFSIGDAICPKIYAPYMI